MLCGFSSISYVLAHALGCAKYLITIKTMVIVLANFARMASC